MYLFKLLVVIILRLYRPFTCNNQLNISCSTYIKYALRLIYVRSQGHLLFTSTTHTLGRACLFVQLWLSYKGTGESDPLQHY